MKQALKKIMMVLCCYLFLQTSYGIDLQSKIPKTAQYVFTIHGQNILNKMSLEEMGKLSIMNAPFMGDSIKMRIGEFGLNLNATFYFYVEMTDSILYFTYLFPISDVKQFESVIARKGEIKKDAKGNNYVETSSTNLTTWTKDYGAFIIEMVVSEYFTKVPDTYKRYGYKVEEVIDYSNNVMEDAAVDTLATESLEDSLGNDAVDYNYTNTYDDWSIKQKYRDTIGMIWAKQKAIQLFSLPFSESISTNVKFVESQDKTAEGIFWFGSSNSVLSSLMYSMNTPSSLMLKSMVGSALFSDKNYFVASIHCNEKDIKVDVTSTMDPRLTKNYEKMVNAKLNKNFSKYIPSENLLGYYSFAYNTQAVMEETPKLMMPYLDMIPYAKNISSDIIDLYALMIDEEAIGKLFKGDGIFAVTNLVTTEVPYSTYEYDSLYNYTEIKKMKNETFPEFVFMYSTEDVIMTEKILGMFYKTGLCVKKEEGYYESSLYSGSPFKLYLLQKEGIVFICNTQQQLEIILKGKVEKGLSKEHLKRLKVNTANVFVDIKKILERFPNMTEENRKMDMLTYGRKNVEILNFTQSKPKGNTIKSEMVLNIPKGNDNSVKYLFNMINDLYLLSK